MKKTLRNLISVFVMILALISTTTITMAHSGRTDSSGGHKDNKNASGLGYYHYHHGYGPHLHTNGVCAYDAPVKTTKPVIKEKAITTKPVINKNYLINYNRKNIKLYDDLIEKNDKVFAPIIQVAKEMGYSVEYDSKSNKIYINGGTDLIKNDKKHENLEIYFNNVFFDTSKYKLEVINGVIYAPIVDYSELLQCKITQDTYTKTIYIKWS